MKMQWIENRGLDPGIHTLLRCGELHLLLPQQDICLLELASNLVTDAPPPSGLGWITFQQQAVPVFSLSTNLKWQERVTDERPICVLLKTAEKYFALLCNEAALLRSSDLSLQTVPQAMIVSGAPFQQLALHGEHLACVSSAAQLFAWLPTPSSAKPCVQEAGC